MPKLATVSTTAPLAGGPGCGHVDAAPRDAANGAAMREPGEELSWARAAHKRKNIASWLVTAAVATPFAARAIGFAEAGPYVFAILLIVIVAIIFDGQIDEIRRRR